MFTSNPSFGIERYSYPNKGAWGITLDETLRDVDVYNTTFSQKGYLESMINGCLPRPCRPLPSYPPKPHTFIYPTLQKKDQEILSLSTGCPSNLWDLEKPYAEAFIGSAPVAVLNKYNPNECPASGVVLTPEKKIQF